MAFLPCSWKWKRNDVLFLTFWLLVLCGQLTSAKEAEAHIEELNSRQLAKLLDEKDFVAVLWSKRNKFDERIESDFVIFLHFYSYQKLPGLHFCVK